MSAKTGKKGGASGKKAVKDENEKAVVSVSRYCMIVCVFYDGVCVQELLIGQLLKSRDLEGSVVAVRKLTSVPSDTLTTLLITKTLGKSGNHRHWQLS